MKKKLPVNLISQKQHHLSIKKITLLSLTMLFVAFAAFADGIKINKKTNNAPVKDTSLVSPPVISYAHPHQTYHLGTSISTLTPTASGVAAYGFSSNATTIGTGSGGVATDAAGNVYWGSEGSVKKMAADGSGTVTYASGFGDITGIAIDLQGNMYVSSNPTSGSDKSGTVKKIAAGTSNPVTFFSHYGSMDCVAVDAAGNVYAGGNGMSEPVKLPADGGDEIAIGERLSQPSGIAVDGNGVVYVSSFFNNNIYKVPPQQAQVYLASLFKSTGLAVSGGNLYVASGIRGDAQTVKMIAPGSSSPVIVASGFTDPRGVAFDPKGNLIVTETNSGPVRKISPVGGYFISPELPAGLSFDRTTGAISGTPTVGSPATDYTITAYNAGGSTSTTVNLEVVISNADLSALSANAGSLNPVFSASKTNYEVSLSNYITAINMYAKAVYAGSTIKINGTPVANGGTSAVMPLAEGWTKFTVEVTAPDHITTKTYTLTVKRDKPYPTLTNLALSSGTLSRGDVPFSYRASVPNGVSSITVTATSADSIKINGTPVLSGKASANIALREGYNYITMLVTRRDTAMSTTYDLTVTRLPPLPTVNYAGAQTYHLSRPISTLTPVSTGVAAYSFNREATTIGTGGGGVATDAAGNVYWASNGNIRKMTADGSSTVTFASGFGSIKSISIDRSGNMYVADNTAVGTGYNGSIKKIAAGTSTAVTIYSFNASSADGVATDAAGNVYAVGVGMQPVVVIPADGSPNRTISGFFGRSDGVAVDGSGTVYVAGGDIITKIPPGGGNQISLTGSFNSPAGLAISGGNLYIADRQNQYIKMRAPGESTAYILGTKYPWGVALDRSGNLIVTEQDSGAVKKYNPVGGYFISPELPAGLSFDRTTGAISGAPTAASPATNYTITAYNTGGGGTAMVNIEVIGDNANLSALAVSSGKLSPAFSQSVTGYTVTYPADATSISISPKAIDAAATIKINGTLVASGSSSAALPLNGGKNTFVIVVTASNHKTTKTYTITANKFITPPVLTALSTSAGTLSPAFSATTLNYNVSVPNSVSDIKVTATSTDTIKVNGSLIASGIASANIPLTEGNNTVRVSVTLPDTAVTQVYTLTVTRLPVIPTVHYAGAQTFHLGKVITALTPSSTGVAAFGFSTSATTIGMGGYKAVATDAAGNVYWADYDGNIKKLAADGSGTTTFASGIAGATGMAIDRKGNIYVAETMGNVDALYDGDVKKIAAGTTTPVIIYSVTNSEVLGVNTDAAGNAYVITENRGLLYFHAAGNPAEPPVNVSSMPSGSGVAVDGSGNVYVSDWAYGKIYKLMPGKQEPDIIEQSPSMSPEGMAISGGNLYFADRQNGTVRMIANGAPSVVVARGFTGPWGIALDGNGNLIVAEFDSGPVRKISPLGGYFISPELPAGLSFDKATGVISGTPTTGSPATDYTITAYNAGGGGTTKVNIGVTADNADLSGLTLGTGTLSPAFSPSVTNYTVSYPNTTKTIYFAPTTVDARATIKLNGKAATNGNYFAPLPLAEGWNTFTIEVTASDQVTKKNYTIIAKRAAPTPVLTALTISAGTLSPAFSATALSYTTAVPNSVYGIKVTAASADTIKINGTPVVSGAESANIPLTEGNNTITVLVTRRDTAVSQTYTITAIRLPVIPTVHYAGAQTYHLGKAITALTPSSTGVAAYGFSTSPTIIGTGNYAVATDVAGNVYWGNRGTVKKLAADGSGTTTFASGFDNVERIALDRQGNMYVTDWVPDGNSYSSTLKKVPAGSSVPVVIYNLPGGRLKGVATDAAGNVYVVDDKLAANVLEIPFDGSPNRFLGGTYSQCQGIAVDGAGNVYVSNGHNGKIYKLPASGSLVAIASSVSGAGMTVSGGNLYFANPIYTVEMIASGASRVTVLDGLHYPSSVALDRNGNLIVASDVGEDIKKYSPIGGYFISPELPAGLSFDKTTGVISGKPTAGSPATDYTITAYNAGGGASTTVNIAVTTANADLANLVIDPGKLNPAFSAAITNYTTVQATTKDVITVKPVKADGNGDVTVNGTALSATTNAVDIPLSIGQNTIVIVVKSSDNTTTKTYTLKVTRQGTPPPVSYGGSLIFYAGTPAQYLPTSSNVIKYSISPELPAGLSIDPQSGIISGTATTLLAATNYVVTATNDAGSTTSTVNISVLQAAANNTILSSLSLSTRTALTKVSGSAMVNYASNVSATTTALSVIPTVTDQDATITVNGVAVASGAASDPITLNTSGPTVIHMLVTARDGKTAKTYSITINRTASSNAFLAHLLASSGTTLNYAAGTSDMNYSTNVGNVINSLTVTPTTSDANATVTVNGTPVTSGTASGAITLNAFGPTVINLLVTAQDGITTKSYSITVNRQRSSNARLKGFYLSTKPFLSPASGPATFNYATTVDVNTAKVTVTPTLADLNARVTVNGQLVASGLASDSIALNPPAMGPTIINMLVTAEDGITTTTYSVAVTRSVSSNANLTGIYILPYYALTYGEKNTLSASVPDTLSSVRVNPSVIQGASVTVNGMAVTSGTSSAPVTLGAGSTSISVVVTAPDSITTKTYTIVLNKLTGHSAAAGYNAFAVVDVVVNPALSPNGDGINDRLTIDNITSYPDNKITIMDVSGTAIYTQKGYDNASVVFDGHASNGKMQKPGTYYYLLEYKAGNENRRKTGYIIIKN